MNQAVAPRCVPNIGARGIRRRRTSGILFMAAAVALAAALLAVDAPRWSRSLVFLPLFAAGIGLFQARQKT